MVECNHIKTHQQMDRQRCGSQRSGTNLPRQFSLGGYNEYIKRNLPLHPYHHSIMTPQEYKELIKKDTIKIGQDVDDLPWDDYEDNLLNYFCGMTPQESRRFNKMKRDHGVK